MPDSPGSPTPPPPAAPGRGPAGPLVCSARGCRAPAAWGLRWNNPRLHAPERRKTWLACSDHREHLSTHLAERSFLREVVAVDELPGGRE
ncbi:hypothetical protein WDV85_08825 [Pseudokineococcus sp. 5B2Z-1]|uniref:hypothetical protein n=1 Tax=Pseudokineococcus sp. 5B2Z-1 TaxID=3132744 RepID=UPI0030B3458C